MIKLCFLNIQECQYKHSIPTTESGPSLILLKYDVLVNSIIMWNYINILIYVLIKKIIVILD